MNASTIERRQRLTDYASDVRDHLRLLNIPLSAMTKAEMIVAYECCITAAQAAMTFACFYGSIDG